MWRNSMRFGVAMTAAAGLVALAPSAACADDPVIHGCVVTIEDNIDLPAPEPGVLVMLSVKEGTKVRRGDVIAKIDDREAVIQREAAEHGLKAAYKSATDDVQIRYAKKSAAVAEKNYQVLIESNKSTARAVPEIEVLKAKLEWDASVLSAEKAIHDQSLAVHEYNKKLSERDAADLAIRRRSIVAPFDGEIVELYRHQDEWVSPGDPIVQLVRLDTMVVEGAVEIADYDPHEIMGADVVVEVTLARGRKEQLTGRITYVSSLVRDDDRYIVRAEVSNREEYGGWLLRDGMTATMTIRLNTAGNTAVDVSRAQ